MSEQADASAVRGRMVAVGELNVHVLEAGSGAPVLLLHGFPQSSREYVAVMADLSQSAYVIAPDLRGAGKTDAPAKGYDVDTLVADVIGLLDALDLDRVVLVAHDWSALIGFDLCLRHPERVSRYVAIAVPAPYIRMTPKLAGAMMRAMPHLWFQWGIAMPGLGPWLLSLGRQRLAYWLLRSFEVQPMRDDDVEAYVAALRDPARARAASKLYRQVILPGFMKILRGTYRGRVLRTPTLVLFGAEDKLLPRDALGVAPEDAPDLIVEFLPGGAHFLVDDNPVEVTRRLRTFAELPAK
ncbi:alpha/beta fold hydrolase [Arthrobacter burdickii]|uniref:Alpha/beta hydrolase n=1 Tax=Arthrobacter burdickii TaxID=3035920 RepID=A0ABT8JWG8_9MICC|nr:alpha/beta hydrolase [Arthrobacter burdickii]MDN4609518.1 alpha/beta hydrolase [Arthrobacter burdickii]